MGVGKKNRVLLSTDGAGRGAAAEGARLVRLALKLLRALRLSGCELSLTLVRDPEMRRLNAEWRARDKPTDVLSFPAGEGPEVGLRPLGDVVISLDTARRVAKELGATPEEELARYLAHGLLHLLGHDHHRKEAARLMRAEEERLLGFAGLLGRAAGPGRPKAT